MPLSVIFQRGSHRVATVVSNYQKDEAGGDPAAAGGCGKSCLKSCCIQGWFLFYYIFSGFCFVLDVLQGFKIGMIAMSRFFLGSM